jgi:hypothetical protein
MHYKKISVLVTTHNGERFIKTQINSIIKSLQNVRNYEILISDDYSKDTTLTLLKNYNNKNIRIFKNNFQNVNKNIKFLLKKSKGDYIFISDQDDIWNVNKITTSLKYFSLGYSFLYHDYVYFKDQKKGKLKEQNLKKLNLFNIFYNNQVAGCTMSFHKKCVKYITPIPSNIIYDWWILIKLYLNVSKLKIKHINVPLLKYRIHSNNQINNLKKNKKNILFKLNYRLKIIYTLLREKF